jgi:hypothetical protein
MLKSVKAALMARSGKRHVGKIVYYTPEELARVTEEARLAGMPAGRYIHDLSLAQKIRARPGHAAEEKIYQLARIGNNVNQLAKMAHVLGLQEVEGQARDILATISQLLMKD